MRHSFILNESGLKWGGTRGNNSSPWPNCTSPFITPVLLTIKCCCQVWLQGGSKGIPKLVHSYCKTVLVLENKIWFADEDLCTNMLNIRSFNFRGLHLHYPHEESAWAANLENHFDVLTKESFNKSKQGILSHVGKCLLWLTVRLWSENKASCHFTTISLSKTTGYSKFI